MEQVLSNEEVSALMSALSDEEQESISSPVQAEASDYDLTSQDRIVRGRLPGLDHIHDRAARGFGRDLSLMLRAPVSVIGEPGALIKHGEFMAVLSVPAKLGVLRAAPLPGHLLLAIDPPLADRLIGAMLGGSLDDEQSNSGSRGDVTPVEERLLRKLFVYFNRNLEKAWSGTEPLTIETVRVEFDPVRAAIGLATDLVVASSFEIHIDGDPSGRLHLAIPFATIEPVRKSLGDAGSSAEGGRDPKLRANLEEIVKSLPVEVRCIFGEADMTLRSFLKLRVGDVLRLDTGPNEDINCMVEGNRRYRGQAVTHAGNLAFEISALIAGKQER